MSDCIMLHFAGGRQIHIKFCLNDSFFIPDRFCQIMPIWINNAASSSAHKSWKFRYNIILLQLRRVWTASDNHISVDKEIFSFDCNMLNFHANNSLLVWFSLGLNHLKSISLYIRHLIIQLMIFQNPHLSLKYNLCWM